MTELACPTVYQRLNDREASAGSKSWEASRRLPLNATYRSRSNVFQKARAEPEDVSCVSLVARLQAASANADPFDPVEFSRCTRLMEAECERRGLPEDWEVEVFERLRQQRQGDNSACAKP